MAAYKRSDPTKLAKEREQIAQSQEAMKPQESTLSLFGRALKQGVAQIGQKLQQNKERAEGYGAPYGGRPVLNGAKVLPGRRKRTYKDNSA
jgi:hypothetical protein